MYVAIMKSQTVKKADAIAALEQDGLPKGAASAHYHNPIVKAAIATGKAINVVGHAIDVACVVKDMGEAVIEVFPVP